MHAATSLKVILLGPAGVGKSNLVNVFTKASEFNACSTATIGVEFASANVPLPAGGIVKCQIWDTAGQERFRSLTANYYRGCDAALMVYDVSNKRSFDDLGQWLEDLRAACRDPPQVMVVGNKADLDHAVKTETGREWAGEVGASFTETSAKTGAGVQDAFYELIRARVAVRALEREAAATDTVTPTPEWTVEYPTGRCLCG